MENSKSSYSINEIMDQFGDTIVNTDVHGIIKIGSKKVNVEESIVTEISHSFRERH